MLQISFPILWLDFSLFLGLQLFFDVFSAYKWPPNLQSNRFLGICDTIGNYYFLKSMRISTKNKKFLKIKDSTLFLKLKVYDIHIHMSF